MFCTKQSELGFSDLLPSGKYKGKKVLAICVEDMDYLRWMMNNGTIFAFNVAKCILGTKPKPFDYKKYNKAKKNASPK
jgi:hypothetical protein